jgi:predicted nicotinamide N-methyase
MALTDPYWGFAWAGGQALARYVLDHPGCVTGRRVFDFGAGCGIEAIAAAKAGAASVIASDVDGLAIEAVRLNAVLNGVTIEATTADFIGDPLDGLDVVLAGDMFYDPEFSRRVLAWLADLAAAGETVLLGDPGRGNLDGAQLKPLATYMAPADVDVDGKLLRETGVYGLGRL